VAERRGRGRPASKYRYFIWKGSPSTMRSPEPYTKRSTVLTEEACRKNIRKHFTDTENWMKRYWPEGRVKLSNLLVEINGITEGDWANSSQLEPIVFELRYPPGEGVAGAAVCVWTWRVPL
jgi:hypothetical protein